MMMEGGEDREDVVALPTLSVAGLLFNNTTRMLTTRKKMRVC
jgi:hypothetical protein